MRTVPQTLRDPDHEHALTAVLVAKVCNHDAAERPRQITGGKDAQGLSLANPIGKAGGKEQLILNTEFRIPLPIKQGLGLAVFYDGGNVFPGVGFSNFTSLYTNSVGLGLRYATPVGPVRIDLGHNLNPVPGVKSTQYFVSIGQAF